jgi:hypothetical protein
VSFFSDFQFALPAKMQIVDGSDGIIADVATALHPTVIVTDLGGEPVNGAVVHFFTGSPAAGDANAVASGQSGGAGLASAPWTMAAGANTITVSGRGIASPSINGPRGVALNPDGGPVDTYFDPFQPIQASFDGTGGSGTPVDVKTGVLTFQATGVASPLDAFGFGGGGYVYQPVPPSGAMPSGWEQPSFVPHMATWSVVSAPFGSPAQCGDAPPIATSWPTGTETSPSDILVRKSFVTSQDGDLNIQIHIDNDVRVWLDGTEITSGFYIHENCATLLPPAFTTHVTKGTHLLAVQARDRGGVSFLDIKLQAAP